MSATEAIPFTRLAIGLIPTVIVILIMGRWSQGIVEPSVALARMVAQLIIIGGILTYIFNSDHSGVVLLVCCVMVLAAAWIALRTVPRTPAHYAYAVVAIAIGGGIPFAIATQLVLQVDPWYAPRSMVPLAGMVFANGMNAVSLAAERFSSECEQGVAWSIARTTAMRAAMIPITNGLMAVGLVSIPGFMTGQILNGVEPLVAARAQIMIMCMVYGSVGLSTIGYLALVTRKMEGS